LVIYCLQKAYGVVVEEGGRAGSDAVEEEVME
jgi:hypothetical protein